MAMLAERRRKTKFVLQPLSKPLWAKDDKSVQYGQKMMEKMGWTAGKGLGAHEQGISEPVRAVFKQDTKGVGFKGDGNPFHNQDEFNALLQNLASANAIPSEESQVFESLEEKSKKSKARVHYKKFTSGKDLSKYSMIDLQCIVGNGKKEDDAEEVTHEEETKTGETENAFGVTTVHGGSIADYFKMKWKSNKEETCCQEDIYESGEPETVREVDNEELERADMRTEGKKRNTKMIEEDECTNEIGPAKNGELQDNSEDVDRNRKKMKKKRKHDQMQCEPPLEEKSKPTPSVGLEMLCTLIETESAERESKKKKKEKSRGKKSHESKSEKQKNRKESNVCAFTECSEVISSNGGSEEKKKRKKEKKEDSIEESIPTSVINNKDKASKSRHKRRRNDNELENYATNSCGEQATSRDNDGNMTIEENEIRKPDICESHIKAAQEIGESFEATSGQGIPINFKEEKRKEKKKRKHGNTENPSVGNGETKDNAAVVHKSSIKDRNGSRLKNNGDSCLSNDVDSTPEVNNENDVIAGQDDNEVDVEQLNEEEKVVAKKSEFKRLSRKFPGSSIVRLVGYGLKS